MMGQIQARRFEEAVANYDRGDYSQALQEFEVLSLELTDPWDKGEALYRQIITLVVMRKITDARRLVADLNGMVASLIKSPVDGYEYDLRTCLPVMARHAELRVTVEEGNSEEALRILDDVVSRYPKQLSIPEFQTVSRELKTLRGMLLCDVGRWDEAKPLLESSSPPTSWKGVHTYYLGHCYYELGISETSKAKLLEALEFDLPRAMESKAHYMLGLLEYNFSDVKAAKRQFELCAKTADEQYIEMAKLWAWLETTSRCLGLFAEAENYRKLMIAALPKKVN